MDCRDGKLNSSWIQFKIETKKNLMKIGYRAWGLYEINVKNIAGYYIFVASGLIMSLFIEIEESEMVLVSGLDILTLRFSFIILMTFQIVFN